MIINTFKKSNSKLVLIILVSIILDYFFIKQINYPPAWDQGFHLSNAFKMQNILSSSGINLIEKIKEIINVTNSYRGPLTYFLTASFLKIFNDGYIYAYLSNQIFNIICILSIFNLGKLFNEEKIGVWASLIFTFSSLVLNQRSDYLIDLSLTSFITLNLLFFSKWYFDNNKFSKFSILSGISLGFIFLTKPTGIIFFFFPFILILINSIKKRHNTFLNFNEIFLFIISYLIVIFPWFSTHWLTIITSIINAWNWGINYQEGLEANSLESWFFYFKKLPYLFGTLNFSIISIIFFVEKLFHRDLLKINIKKYTKLDFWFFTYFLNFYLVVSLMSSKDIRFILPIYPLFCIYLSIFINSNIYKFFNIKNKKIILIISLSISILFYDKGLISNGLGKNSLYNWPHSEIIKEIKKVSPNIISTLAVLPDTREINTFNLEAEASRQGEYVAVRQTISNQNTYKEDLKYFDWFLVKTGNQGIMSNISKNLLNEYLWDNNSFLVHKQWELPDKSRLFLLRRMSINTYLSEKKCKNHLLNLDIKQTKNGINLSLIGDGRSIRSSTILIDFIGNDFLKSTNLSLANGLFHESFNEDKCYSLSQDIPVNFSNINSKNLVYKARILNKDGELIFFKNINNQLLLNENLIENDYLHMTNRISKVELLGSYLRKGEFKNLFDLVGIINQSDPKQIYLNDAEKIYTQRYKENKATKNLYSVLISQILQKKVDKANETINLILDKDKNNGNTYLAKAIINIYLFDSKNARLAINKTRLFDKSEESYKYLNIVEGLTNLLEFKFIDAYKLLS